MKSFVKRVLVVMTVCLLCFQSNVLAGLGPEDFPVKDNFEDPPHPRVQCIMEAPSCNYSESEVGIQAYFREAIIRLLDLFHLRQNY